MNSREKVPIYDTIFEVAELNHVPSWDIERLVRCGIHPPYHWGPRMNLPRFHPKYRPEWARILRDVDRDSLPENPSPLRRRPERCERTTGPSEEELNLAAKILGVKGPKKGHRPEAHV
ncbi:MAG: hypothetical protein HY914_10135 [Desulfomonile tiedjei]|nr:hypothetical protein [Desulfomonile tiedjei]